MQALGDAGYYSAENIDFLDSRGIDGLLSVGREKHVLDEPASTKPKRDARPDMRERLHTAIGKGAYSRRKCILEPVFGQIKDAQGIRTFLRVNRWRLPNGPPRGHPDDPVGRPRALDP